MATKCLICEKNKKGSPISDDVVIRSIRRIKRRFGIAKNNKIVICKDCMSQHLERRANFEKRLVRYGALGFIVAAVLIILSPSLFSVFAGLFMGLLMLSFALPSYHPALVSYPKKRGKGKK